jgi:hypothetical protein
MDHKGAKFSEILLDLNVSKDGKLEGFSLFSAQSASRKRHFELANIKEIRQLNRVLYSVPEESDPVVLESKRLEQEMLLREKTARREHLASAYKRQAGLERAAGLLRDENGQFPLYRRYEEELGDGAIVVGALADLAANQAAESRPQPETPPASDARTPTETPTPTEPQATQSQPAEPSTQVIGRKSVTISYRSRSGQPPSVRYGVRIRYETGDSEDPKVQQGALDESGQCVLEVPEDVQSIRVFTTPFGGFEGTHPLKSSDSTTISITTEGN